MRNAVAASLLGALCACSQTGAFTEQVRHSGFTFVGTVQELGAATPTVVREPNSAVVHVDRILEALPPVGNVTGQEVTVSLLEPAKAQVGDRRIFFTYVHSAGSTLGLVEVAEEAARDPDGTARQIGEARQSIADEELSRRLASAELVVVGVVGEATRTEAARHPEGEHDPLWWSAPVRVESFVKGSAQEPVLLHFAKNYDFLWAQAPKPKAGAEGIYLLQPDREKRYRVAGLFLVDRLDALPKSELERVRRLLAKQR